MKDGTAYVVTYGGTPEEFDSSLPAFQSIVDSFSLEKQCCHYRETKKRIRIVGGGVKITSENCDTLIEVKWSISIRDCYKVVKVTEIS